ncbi:MAG: hypothetical protein AAGB15_12965 [Pseudomonadota bacterium]
MLCSDTDDHRRRVETRRIETGGDSLPGQASPNWQAVKARSFASWDRVGLTLDTAALAPDAAATRICAWLDRLGMAPPLKTP